MTKSDTDRRNHAEVDGEHAPHTLLVAEDDALILDLLHRVLSRAGYRVLSAADGQAARRLFDAHSHEVHIAVLDMVMPNGSGREVGDYLRHARPDLPIIFCSGHSQERIAGDLVGFDNTTVVRKPYKVSEVLQAIEDLLG